MPARFYVVFVLVFAVMHITGALAGSLPYVFNALISFTTTTVVLIALDMWYSQKNISAVTEALGYRKTTYRQLLPSLFVSLALLAVYPLTSTILSIPLKTTDTWFLNLCGILLTGGLMEESFFRGFVFRHLRERMHFRKAVLTSMVLFALAHLLLFTYMPFPVAVMSTLLAVVISLPFAYLFEKGGNSVWGPALIHAVVRTVGLVVITTDGTKFLKLSLLWMIACMLVPYLVLLFYRDFRNWRNMTAALKPK